MRRTLRRLGRFGPDEDGAAAVEFALWLGVALWPLLNVIDVGFYAYDRVQVENGAQMAVQAVSTSCGQLTAPPVLTNCTAVSGVAPTTLMTNRAQSTSLGTQVTLSAAYECQATSSTTVTVTKVPSTAPAPTCPGTSGSYSGDYIGATVTFTYQPLFNAVTVTSILGTTITRTYWMRVV